MGEPVFDSSRYPSPQAMIENLHGSHFHFMISTWPFFRPGTRTYEEVDRRGLLDTALFRIGTDAWWLDTTEPETEGRETNILVTNRVASGSGARYANLYPLMATTAVYNGQRAETDRKRVFILSRSAYAGSRRTATAVWSGDVNSDWTFLGKQVPAGLDYSVCGLPYWTTDIGGFLPGHPDDPEYRELFVRWFEFGALNPIFRVHGTRSPDRNELWSYGPEAQEILVAFGRLRYRLLPYVCSVAWMTTHERCTPMRALVMDFRTDARAASIGDEFMFDPSILVSPYWSPPPGHVAFTSRAQGGTISGPDVEWATEKPAEPLEVPAYRGAGGSFTLYEDEGDGYDHAVAWRPLSAAARRTRRGAGRKPPEPATLQCPIRPGVQRCFPLFRPTKAL
jgi:alpha-D-xyloside xylohydrolase